MRYGSKYLAETNQRMKEAGRVSCPACSGTGKAGEEKCSTCDGTRFVPHNWMDGWEVDVEGGVNDVNVEEACRALDESSTFGGMPWDRKVWITKLSVVGKKVAVLYNELQIGPGFILTKTDQSFDLFPELKENPPALTRLIDVCISALMGKSMPPQTRSQAPAAGMGGSGASSGR